MADPPTSVRAGMSHHWAAALREAVSRTEGRDVNLKQVTRTVVPHGLHLDYDLDFQTRRIDYVAPTLTSPLLSGLVGNICQCERLRVPREPASFQADEDLWGHGRAPPKPDVPSPSHDNGVASKIQASKGETHEDRSPGQVESPQDQPPLEPDPEEMVEIIISEGDASDITIEEPQGSSTPKSGPAQSRK